MARVRPPPWARARVPGSRVSAIRQGLIDGAAKTISLSGFPYEVIGILAADSPTEMPPAVPDV
jgi:hypothetical protein